MTRKELRDLSILRITKGKPSDDLEIDNRQVDAELDIARNFLINEKIEEENGQVDPTMLTIYDSVAITKQTITDYDEESGGIRYYSTIPAPVLNLKNDIGVYMVETNGGVLCHRITPMDKNHLKHLSFAKPDKYKIAFYRVNDKLYYEGASTSFLKNGMATLYLIISKTVDELDEDAQYPIPEELVMKLLSIVEESLRRQLGVPEDLKNDGKQS